MAAHVISGVRLRGGISSIKVGKIVKPRTAVIGTPRNVERFRARASVHFSFSHFGVSIRFLVAPSPSFPPPPPPPHSREDTRGDN